MSLAAKKRGMVTLRDVVSMAMVMALRNMTTKIRILNALVCRGIFKTTKETLINFVSAV